VGEKSALSTGTEFSHFRVTGRIGAGGMGEVFRARDLTLERDVALKVLPAELLQSMDRVRRFVQEAKAASALNHPNIVTIYEIGQVPITDPDGSPTKGTIHYIAMEFIEGETLRAHIYGETSRRRLVELLVQVADGLFKAHSAGIIHRDLKPDNVMVSSDGFAKIVDFGLAKLTEKKADSKDESGQLTQEGMVMGSVGYMSPEQVQGLVLDQRSDIFSFGCILYEALVRKRPFHAEMAFDTLHRIVFAEPELVEQVDATIPPGLAAVVRKCLRKKPEERYQTIREIGADLRKALHEVDEQALNSAPTVVVAPAAIGAPVQSASMKPPSPVSSQRQATGRESAPRRRGRIRSYFSTIALLVLTILSAYLWWTFPDIKALRNPPPSTARIEAAAAHGQALPLYRWVRYEEISPALRKTVVHVDDPLFYETERPTMDGIQRASTNLMRTRRLQFGASKIARSVATELYLADSKNPLNALRRWVIAIGLEHLYTKKELLELYLNVTPFGEGAIGAEAAAKKHFGKSAHALTSRQATLLVAARERGEWDLQNPGDALRARQEELQAFAGGRSASSESPSEPAKKSSKGKRSRKQESEQPAVTTETAAESEPPKPEATEPVPETPSEPSGDAATDASR
jgi:serine/threonine protein kinase